MLANPELQLFGHGLVRQLVGRPVRPAHVTPRVANALVVAFGWLPLVVLSALERSLTRGDIPFVRDFAVHVRMLVELPVLLAAVRLAEPLATRAVEYIYDSGLVPDANLARFRGLVASTRRVGTSRVVAAAAFAIAVLMSWAEMSTWAEMAAGSREVSWRIRDGAITNAGLWFALVARPMLYAQLALWVYRFALWAWFLVRMSRMIKPMAAHPDGVGGLQPLNPAHAAFAVIAFVIGADLAAGLANRAVHVGVDVFTYRGDVAAIVVVTTSVLLAPMLAFVPGLYRARVQATFDLGNASTAAAREIDERLARAKQGEPLDRVGRAFTYHLHTAQSLEHVRRLAPTPLNRRTIMLFAVAVTVPFLLATLTEISPTDLLRRVHGLVELNPVEGGEKGEK